MDSRQHPVKALAILQMKDGIIEKLERQLDAVQTKMAFTKRNLLQAEQQRVESEQAARQLAWEAALKAEKASGRVETAVEEVRELSLDCRAAEAVSKRLQAELNELREKDSKDSQHAELSEDLVAAVRLAVQRHKVLLAEKKEDCLEVPGAVAVCAPRLKNVPSMNIAEVKKAQVVLGDAKKDLEMLNEGCAGKSKVLQRELFETTKDLEMLKSELQAVQCHDQATLLGRASALLKCEAAQKARLKLFRPSAEALPVLKVTGCTIDVNASEETTAQMRQELSKLRREALAEAERGDGLRSELKSMAEALESEPRLPLPRLPLSLSRQLAEMGSKASDLPHALEQLLELLRRQNLQGSTELPGFAWQPAAPLHCSQLQEELSERLAEEDVAKASCGKLKAQAVLVSTELTQQRKRCEVLEAEELVEAAAAAEVGELNINRDDLVEQVWCMAQRANYSELPKDQVLRILGLQLCAMELGWLLERRQIHGDHLLRANSAPQRQATGRDAEATHLSLQALRLNAEVRAMQMEMESHPEPASEDQEMLLSTLSVMREAMQVSESLVTESGADCSRQLLDELQDVSASCERLQHLVQGRERPRDKEPWPQRLESLLQSQHEMQLEYRSAAQEVLRLRESSLELAQAQRQVTSRQEPLPTPLPAVAPLPEAPGLAELEELRVQHEKTLATSKVEASEALNSFKEAGFSADAASTYAVAVRGWAQVAEREAQVAQEALAVAQQEALEATVLQRRRRHAEAEELVAEEVRELQAEEARQSARQREEERLLHGLSEKLGQLNVENQELRGRLAPLSAHAAELERRRQALEPAAEDFPHLPGLVQQLEAMQTRIEDEEMRLLSVRISEQEQEAEIAVYNTEAGAQRQVAKELEDAVESQELSFEALEARERWQELAQRDEQLEWRQQIKVQQEKALEMRRAREAAEESQLEVEYLMRQDALRRDIGELEDESQTLERLLSQPTSPVLQRASLQAYVDELELLSMQKEELLEEMDALRSAVARPKQKRKDDREQREAFRKLQVQKKEEEQLRHQLKEVEEQLQLSREDADRKRSFVSQLQRSLKEVEPSRTLELQEELQRARQLLQRKDAQLARRRSEASEARARRSLRRSERLEAERLAQRSGELQAALRRKDRLLSKALAQTELLESLDVQ